MARQSQGTPRYAAGQSPRTTRTTQTKMTRTWPQFAVLGGVLVLLIIGFVLMLRPAQRVQKDIYPVAYQDAIVASCARHGVSPYLVCAIIKCESGWRDDAVSNVGATGLMQVMPSTATSLVSLGYVDEAAFPPENLQDPIINIEYGCATLEYLAGHLNSVEQVIAAYNAGLGTVQAWIADQNDATPFEERITYTETSLYLARVSEALKNYEALYDTGLNER